MKTGTKVFCGPCDFKHISVPAVAWCPVCNEGTCKDCKDQHSAFSLTRNHDVIDIENYKKLPDFVVSMAITCFEHDKKLEFYCRTHNVRCCLTCIPEKHQKCPNVTTIEDVIKNVKTSPAYIDAIQGWEDLLSNVIELIRVKQKHIDDIKQTKTAIETDIKNFRKEINDLLDKFEMRSLHNLDNIYSRITMADQKVITDLKERKVEMELFQAHCENVSAFASDLQAFVAVQHISEKLAEEESKLVSFLGSSVMQSTVFAFDKNNILRSLDTKMKDLGSIKTYVNNPNFKLSQRKSDQAQFLPITRVQSNNIQNFKFCLKEALSLSTDKYALNIKDCTILPDDRCVFTDYSASKRLLILFPLSKRCIDMTVPFAACGITSIESSIVALLVQDENEIQIIELQNENYRLEQTIKLQNRGWSLSSCNGRIAVSVKDQGILLINKNGKQFAKIPIKCEYHVAVHLTHDKLYYADLPSHTVHCCSLNGKAIWNHHISNERNQYSIATDNDGHVFVSCLHTNEIIVLSGDGKMKKSVETINSPSALAFKRNGTELMCASTDGKVEFLGLSNTVQK